MKFYEELKRRQVLRVAAAYIVGAWLVIQVADAILPHYELEHHVRTVITLLAIGFIPAVVLAWAFEWTPQGIVTDRGADDTAVAERPAGADKRFDRAVIAVLTIALAFFIYDKLVPDAPDAEVSLAVLPFENESPEQVPDYLAEGIAGEVLELLARLPEIFVIAQNSAFKLKGQDLPVREIGSRLGVAFVLTGALQQLGDRMQVRARLFDAASGDLLWNDTYLGSLGEIFAIQDRIVSDVVERLQVTSAGVLPKARQTTPEVLALTLQARKIWYDRMAGGGGDEMAALLDEALEIDPQYTPALVWMVYANWLRKQAGQIDAEEEQRRWLSLAGRILAIEPDNASVHNLFAWEALYVNRDIDAAASSFARALSSAPNDPEILRHVSRFVQLLGRHDQAVALLDRAMTVDPLCSLCLYGMSKAYMYSGELDKAERARRRFVSLHGQGHYDLGLILLLQGKAEEALTVYEDLLARAQTEPGLQDGRAHAGLTMALHELGRHEESDTHMQALLATTHPGRDYALGQAHAWRGELDAAFEILERQADTATAVLVVLEPVYRNLHDDPRWLALRDQLGVAEERLERVQFSVPPALLNTAR